MPIRKMCWSLAHRLKEIEWVEAVSLEKKNFIPFINANPWDPTTLSHGYPGLICLFSEMDWQFPNEGWDEVTHNVIEVLVGVISSQGVHNATLFSGLSGICFAIYLASKNGSRYKTLFTKLHHALLDQIEAEYLLPIRKRSQDSPFPARLCDTITGITGVLAYFLCVQWTDQRTVALVRVLLEYLVFATLPIHWKGCMVPGWLSAPEDLVREETRHAYPLGCFDTGVAHGIAGPLAILSKAYKTRIVVGGHVEAISRISRWLIQTSRKVGSVDGVWPSRFGFSESAHDHLEVVSTFYRDGWCYGAPGIATALFEAGCALNDSSLKSRAIAIMEAACSRFLRGNRLQCVSFCHGLAGFLCMVHQMQLRAPAALFTSATRSILKHIKQRYDEMLPFGFTTLGSIPNSSEEVIIDNAGLIDGVAGTLLSLLFINQSSTRPWTQLFLIH